MTGRVFMNILIVGFFYAELTPVQTHPTCNHDRAICVSYTATKKPASSYFNWTMQVTANQSTNQRNIDSVTYYLPRTFSPRVITIRKQAQNPSYKFDLRKSGQGEFNVNVKIFEHKKPPFTIEQSLRLR